jgi:hypothetical protein
MHGVLAPCRILTSPYRSQIRYHQDLPRLRSRSDALTLARPSIHFANLNECVYRCDCGEEAEYVMMRPEPE